MRSAVSVLVFCAVAFGCEEKPMPCFGIEKGDRFDIEIVERYDENSSFRGGTSSHGAGCGPDWDFWIGDLVTVRVLAQRYHEARTCTGSIITLEPEDGSQLEILRSRTENVFPKALFDGLLDVRVGGCDGGLEFQVWDGKPTEDLFAVSVRGDSPFFHVNREYKAFADCPVLPEGSCGDNFVVNIHPHAD